ncbi:NADPH:quinone reductase-like Zn-dependent oxidoreductase [Actinoplanes campanulatus]|uniref:NADPH:quinone reductase-like Zn-dependent oxidoreductase n=1 Tax=Actinoplanes campanulatus TaxID=113559 RepID=A0A7W5ARA9_9ACTN|nr:NAD(P)-dependent alcohol dehydrogenase [Actinoplanes campanulatus]MBB3100996.1 NADPH:quinone reductase-like Zn-dependent oxidoreductase [Actinoplanes campanulatus]GGN49162.1 NADPH:quinone reductase [Actinoplanes campanulatus]GID41814.1 NADPH:quinone reductase [Actinoplanes campanulatus]
MRALVQTAFGSPGQLALQQVTDPVPGPGDLLVRVHAAGLNAADRMTLRGEPFGIRAVAGGLRRPRAGFVVGRALAGRVEAVGDGVRDHRVGADVLAETPAAVGELARVPARLAAAKPAGLSFTEAAALPLAGTTALQSIRDAVGARAGRRVLITGASGGIGTFAVQLAAARGAIVTASCAGRNAGLVRALGAGGVVDYERREPLAAPGEGYDAILDLAGNYTLAELRQALRPGGVLVLSVGTGGRWLGPARRILTGKLTRGGPVRTLLARPDREDLTEIAEMAAAGELRPVIDRVYPFPEAAAALHHLDRGRVAGKIVIAMTGEPG